jgi:CheY-like chemotaxis protein
MSIMLLYAEDDSEHRLMMRLIMKDTNAVLISVANGEEALRQIQEQQPDIILLDLFLPKLDGFEVMEALKSNPATQHIPVIIVSARLTPENRERARQIGASDFIAKPYDPFDLLMLVDKHLTKSKRFTSPEFQES